MTTREQISPPRLIFSMMHNRKPNRVFLSYDTGTMRPSLSILRGFSGSLNNLQPMEQLAASCCTGRDCIPLPNRAIVSALLSGAFLLPRSPPERASFIAPFQPYAAQLMSERNTLADGTSLRPSTNSLPCHSRKAPRACVISCKRTLSNSE